MIENICRFIEAGHKPMDAARRGMLGMRDVLPPLLGTLSADSDNEINAAAHPADQSAANRNSS